jgi:8-oxo-dGTP diphosphatase
MPPYLAWLRAQVGPALLPLIYTTALVRDPQGRVLFQKRADFGAAWWGLPGGLFEPGETHAVCLEREVCEETGLHVEPTRFIGVYTDMRYAVRYPNGDQAQQITFCYECRIVGGTLRADGDESVALAFFEPSALPPRPPWYAAMLDDALSDRGLPTFDPPVTTPVETPYPTLLSVRRIVGHAPLLWPGANAFVVNAAGDVLLMQRGDFGNWAIPAGALDTGETLAQTAARETHEETGLIVRPRAVLGSYGGYHFTYPNDDVLYPIGAIFLCDVTGGQLTADGHEALKVGFFARDRLPAPMSDLARDRIEQAYARFEKWAIGSKIHS